MSAQAALFALEQPAPPAQRQSRADFIDAATRHAVRFITKTKRRGQAHAAYRCPMCSGGVVHVTVRHNDAGKVTGSEGRCTTPDCMTWEE